MHSLATLGLNNDPLLSPSVRRIGFEDGPAQVTVAHLLICAWPVQRPSQECDNPPDGDFKAWTQEVKSLTQEEREQLPRDADTKSYDTPWRNQLYYMWNHVFYDVGNWLSGNYGIGTFKPPNTEAFAIEFPGRESAVTSHENGDNVDGKRPAATRVWDEDILLSAAYLAPGVSVRVETARPGEDDGEPAHPGDFEHGNRYYAWYVKKGLELRFIVEGEQNVDGVAAVMVYGSITGEPVEMESEDEDEDEHTE